MTLAAQVVGKKVKSVLNGVLAEGQIVGAVEITPLTNAALAFGVLAKQIKGTKSSVVLVAIKI